VVLNFILLLAFVAPSEKSLPVLPFEHWEACPFECCKYGSWRAQADVPAFVSRTSSRVAFTIRKGERVQAVTGVVTTRKTGLVVLSRAYTFSTGDGKEITVPAGGRVLTLHPGGEGVGYFWYRGATFDGELYADTVSPSTPEYPREVLSLPKYEWWVKVRNAAGRVAWVRDPTDFKGQDACG